MIDIDTWGSLDVQGERFLGRLHVAALARGLPTLRLGSHTIMVGPDGADPICVSRGIPSHTPTPARALLRERRAVRRLFAKAGVPHAADAAAADHVLVHQGEALVSSNPNDEAAELACRAVRAIPGLNSAIVELGVQAPSGRVGDSVLTVRRVRPRLSFEPFERLRPGWAADLADAFLVHESHGLATPLNPPEVQVRALVTFTGGSGAWEPGLADGAARLSVTLEKADDPPYHDPRFVASGSSAAVALLIAHVCRGTFLDAPPTAAETRPA